MVAEGTVANGMVRLDAGSLFPDGARVRVELASLADTPPSEPELQSVLRESLEDAAAGRTYCAREVLRPRE